MTPLASASHACSRQRPVCWRFFYGQNPGHGSSICFVILIFIFFTTYIKSDEQDLQIEFVTSMHRGGDTPVLIKALNATMQPLKFMEFSMEAPIQVTLLAQRGAITVNAPPPEKYALHKLLVYGERPQNMRTKATKDLDQAASLIEYLAENDADLLHETWLDLINRGPGWRRRAVEGLQALRKRYPGIDTKPLD